MKALHQLLSSGQSAAALAELEERISTAPHDGELLLLKGVALFQTGAAPESEQAFRQALGLGWHTVTQAWKNLASICYRDRRFQEAIDFIAQYREWRPYDREPLALHVSSLVELGRFAEAERELGKFLEVFPDDPESLATLLFCLGLQGRYLELLAYTSGVPASGWKDQKIVRSIAGALAALGLRQAARDVLAAAADAGAEAGAGDPAETERMSRYLRAERALEEHRFVEAIELYQTSIQGSDEVNVGLFNLSIACLAAGRLGEGWRLMRARTALFSMAKVRGVPAWDGQALEGKLILVHSEQGIGDVIQFIRYLPRLEAAGVRVVFNAYPEILRLLCNDPRAKESISNSVSLSELEFDFQAQLLDLPSMLGTESVADIPAAVPYLYANSDRLAHWQRRLACCSGLKIGLVWAGNSEHKQDHHRSARLADFESLAVLPGVTWVILQKGVGESEGLASPEGMPIIRLSDEITSFDDTAAIVECLDLVISVDTSVAHLAGALDKPVWILLSESGKDWRWFLDAERSPWYPSARLFTRSRVTGWVDFIRDAVRPILAQWLFDRQPVSDDWAAVKNAINFLSKTDADENGDDPTGWVNGFERLGFSPLPVARALMRECNESRALASLYALQATDVEVTSAWAEWLSRQGDVAAALALWRSTVAAGGVLPSSGFVGWGDALHEQARYDEARDVWNGALAAFPNSAQLHYMAGRTAQWAGLREAAIPHYERALELSPRHPLAHNNRGILHETDAPFLALASFQRALLFDPNYVKPWQNAARVMLRVNAAKVAVVVMRERCGVDGSSGSRISFARALLESGQMEEAKFVLHMIEEEAVSQDQGALLDRAFLYRELGDSEQCKKMLQHLLAAFPDDRSGQIFYGWQLLAEGRSKEGWMHYVAGCDSKLTVIPEWCGESLHNKSLLVFQDQGMGDLFQFVHLVRNVPDALEVTLAVCDPALELIKYQGFPCRVVAISTINWQSSNYDFQIAQMKLQNLLAVDLAKPPCFPPYMIAPRGLLPHWEGSCAEDRKIKIGIAWAGNPKYLNDFRRSTRLRDWLPLFDLKEVSFYNLQKDAASNQALAWDSLGLKNIAADCEGWEKTANALMLLDMVISVDTGIAHLASCLGKPTWILLPDRGTDFRWLLEREDVPWYPQARLFRQQKNESWADVLLRVKEQLSMRFAALPRHV